MSNRRNETNLGSNYTLDELCEESKVNVEPDSLQSTTSNSNVTDRPLYKLETVEECRRREPGAFMVDGLLKPRDLAIFYGPPKSGKTFVLIDLAVSLAKGKPFAVKFGISQPRRVLIVSNEGTECLRTRIATACQRNELSDEDEARISFLAEMPNFYQGDQDLTRLIESARHFRPDLVIVDTLANAMAGGDENSQKDAVKLMSSAQRLRDELDTAVVFVHHSNKQADLRGSTVFQGSSDTLVSFKVGSFQSAGMKDASEFAAVHFEIEFVGARPGEAVATWLESPRVKVNPLHALVLEVLREHSTSAESAYCVGDVLKRLPGEPSKQRVNDALKSLAASGSISSTSAKNSQNITCAHYFVNDTQVP